MAPKKSTPQVEVGPRCPDAVPRACDLRAIVEPGIDPKVAEQLREAEAAFMERSARFGQYTPEGKQAAKRELDRQIREDGRLDLADRLARLDEIWGRERLASKDGVIAVVNAKFRPLSIQAISGAIEALDKWREKEREAWVGYLAEAGLVNGFESEAGAYTRAFRDRLEAARCEQVAATRFGNAPRDILSLRDILPGPVLAVVQQA